MTLKSSISLTDEQHEFAKTLVASGRFTSVSAVLRRGVELLRDQVGDEALERAALAEILEQRKGGKFVSATAMDARLSHLLERKRQTHAVRD